MYEIVELKGADVRPYRRGVPSVHLLDEMPGSLHLGVRHQGNLIGVVSAFAVSRTGGAEHGVLQLYGPFGAESERLIEALLDRLPTGGELWADSERPGLWPMANGTYWARQAPEPPPEDDDDEAYTTRHIRVLEGLQAVRKRPGMYVGSTEEAGVQALLCEALSNVVDEHLAGHATRVSVSCAPDGTWTVADDGRGIPVDTEGVAERVFCQLHASSKWNPDISTPHVHLGLHGVGIAVVNALSELFMVTVDRGGWTWEQAYRRGHPITPMVRVSPSAHRGTTLRFRPDREVFNALLQPAGSRALVGQLAFLNPRLYVELQGENLSQPGGLVALARQTARDPVTRVVHAQGVHLDVDVEVALAFTTSTSEMRFFVNQHAIEGGSPFDGAIHALADVGPCVVVGHVLLQEPAFSGRTRTTLRVPEAKKAVAKVITDALRA